jgi:predicted HAD superfamily Cof-like phosphohydrolase
MTNFQRVRLFHEKMGLPVDDKDSIFSCRQVSLRMRLILEELSEYAKACAEGDRVEIADALGDILFVVYGSGVEHGIDMDRVFEEICRSNMTKSGGYMDESGKWVKPDDFNPPDLSFVGE